MSLFCLKDRFYLERTVSISHILGLIISILESFLGIYKGKAKCMAIGKYKKWKISIWGLKFEPT
jgi:hypothetical protein